MDAWLRRGSERALVPKRPIFRNPLDAVPKN